MLLKFIFLLLLMETGVFPCEGGKFFTGNSPFASFGMGRGFPPAFGSPMLPPMPFMGPQPPFPPAPFGSPPPLFGSPPPLYGSPPPMGRHQPLYGDPFSRMNGNFPPSNPVGYATTYTTNPDGSVKVQHYSPNGDTITPRHRRHRRRSHHYDPTAEEEPERRPQPGKIFDPTKEQYPGTHPNLPPGQKHPHVPGAQMNPPSNPYHKQPNGQNFPSNPYDHSSQQPSKQPKKGGKTKPSKIDDPTDPHHNQAPMGNHNQPGATTGNSMPGHPPSGSKMPPEIQNFLHELQKNPQYRQDMINQLPNNPQLNQLVQQYPELKQALSSPVPPQNNPHQQVLPGGQSPQKPSKPTKSGLTPPATNIQVPQTQEELMDFYGKVTGDPNYRKAVIDQLPSNPELNQLVQQIPELQQALSNSAPPQHNPNQKASHADQMNQQQKPKNKPGMTNIQAPQTQEELMDFYGKVTGDQNYRQAVIDQLPSNPELNQLVQQIPELQQALANPAPPQHNSNHQTSPADQTYSQQKPKNNKGTPNIRAPQSEEELQNFYSNLTQDSNYRQAVIDQLPNNPDLARIVQQYPVLQQALGTKM